MRSLLVLAALVATAAPAVAGESSLRHVEYDVRVGAAGTTARTHLALELIAMRPDRGCIVTVVESGDLAPVRLDVDPDGTAHVHDGDVVTREAVLLAYFFALGAVNTSGMGAGDAWTSGPARYRVAAARDGVLDLAVAYSAPQRVWNGRLRYDSTRVIPLAFDLHDADGAEIALRLTDDSQGR